jgi:hypothetical protein
MNSPTTMPIAIPRHSARRLSWPAGASGRRLGHPGVHAGVYFLLDPLEEGRYYRVAVLGTQLLVSRRGGADLGDHLAPGGGVRLTRARHPRTGRGLDLVV